MFKVLLLSFILFLLFFRRRLKSKYLPNRNESVVHKKKSEKDSFIEMSTKNHSENVLSAREMEANVDITDEPTYENTALFGK